MSFIINTHRMNSTIYPIMSVLNRSFLKNEIRARVFKENSEINEKLLFFFPLHIFSVFIWKYLTYLVNLNQQLLIPQQNPPHRHTGITALFHTWNWNETNIISLILNEHRIQYFDEKKYNPNYLLSDAIIITIPQERF